MSRRVRSAAAALFALSLLVQIPVAEARWERDRGRSIEPGFIQRIVKGIKQALKPLGITILDDDEFVPTPPRP